MADADLIAGSIAGVAGIATGIFGWLTSRRKSSGRVDTSEASQLWNEAQQFRALLLADKQKVEEQRDRLIEIQRNETAELLKSVIESLGHLSDRLEELGARVLERLSAQTSARETGTDDRPPPETKGL